MSKKSRRRNKMLAAIVGLAGASKLGLLSKSPIGKSGVYETAAKARKMGMKGSVLPTAREIKSKAVSGITKLKPSDIAGRNPKSIFRSTDGTITKGLEKFKDKETFAKTMRKRRGDGSFRDFLNKAILGPKTQLKKGKMVKARGGGMAMRMKPTKLY